MQTEHESKTVHYGLGQEENNSERDRSIASQQRHNALRPREKKEQQIGH